MQGAVLARRGDDRGIGHFAVEQSHPQRVLGLAGNGIVGVTVITALAAFEPGGIAPPRFRELLIQPVDQEGPQEQSGGYAENRRGGDQDEHQADRELTTQGARP